MSAVADWSFGGMFDDVPSLDGYSGGATGWEVLGGDNDFSLVEDYGGVDPWNFDQFEFGGLDDYNYDLSGDFSTDPTGSGSGGSGSSLGSLAGFLKTLVTGQGDSDTGSILRNLAALGLIGTDIYEKFQSNQLGQEETEADIRVKDANVRTADELIDTSQINNYRGLTGQAGGFTGDAYNVGMNNAKMDLMMSLMAADENLPQADRERMTSLFSSISDTYEPTYQNYANDTINARNSQFQNSYNSSVPFADAMGGGQFDVQTFLNSVPDDANPDDVNAYISSLGI